MNGNVKVKIESLEQTMAAAAEAMKQPAVKRDFKASPASVFRLGNAASGPDAKRLEIVKVMTGQGGF